MACACFRYESLSVRTDQNTRPHASRAFAESSPARRRARMGNAVTAVPCVVTLLV